MCDSKVISLISFFLLLGLSHSDAQLLLSEYSASNLNQFPDQYNKYEDWVEIYNEGTSSIDLAGYGLSDKLDNPLKWTFPQGSIIAPEEYLVIWCSGRDEYEAHNYHTNYKLTQTKDNEFFVLSDPQGNIIDSTPLELTLLGHSRANNSAFGSGWEVSEEPTPGEGTFASTLALGYTEAPSISQEAGFYTNQLTVDITNNDTSSVLRYTIDGTEPNSDSPLYENPLIIVTTTVVKARAFSTNPKVLPGKMDFKTYFIDESFSLPVISIAAEGIQELANGDGDLRPIGSIEYFKDNQLSSTSYGELNRHGQDSWVNDQRSLDWVSRDEMGYSKALKENLFTTSDRDEFQRFMMRASGDDNYPAIQDDDHEGSTHIRDEYVHVLAQQAKMKLDVRAVERAIVFLNGEYWGIYSPRERPVDHDYTSFNYDQDKSQLQYILTWGRTWAEYGGKEAFDDWETFRDFVMTSDLSIPENYQLVKDSMQVLGLIDYMLINLNTVCSDWINYNTGWWRGTNPDGNHKKWGYILWDNDATFDYYINYSGVPNTDYDAQPCDIDDIAAFVDEFWAEDFGGFELDSSFIEGCPVIESGNCPYPASDPVLLELILQDFGCCFGDWDQDCQDGYDELFIEYYYPDSCATILNGSCPYPVTDSIYREIVSYDNHCCENEWDAICQKMYDDVSTGAFYVNSADYQIRENFGQHEKIFLKLQNESEEFRQLYYSRQADLMNTTFSCDNMIATLDSMLAIIEPEMPRHIQRWGRSLNEWETNVNILKSFIQLRCSVLDVGISDCFELSGPYDLTLEIFPEGAGDIDLNTIEVKDFPWTGRYFGDMNNNIDADPGPDYDFVRWETKKGTTIFPDEFSENASIMLTEPDTLVAIFKLEDTDSTDDPEQSDLINMMVYPNPSNGELTVQYTLEQSGAVTLELYDLLGEKVYNSSLGHRAKGAIHKESLDLSMKNIASSSYFVRISTEFGAANERVMLVR